MKEHAKSFPFCRFVRGFNTHNRLYRPRKLLADEMKNISIVKSYTMEEQKTRRGDLTAEVLPLGISIDRADTPRFATETSREDSFKQWKGKVSMKLLSNAGFYYTKFGDSVKCFFCSGELKEWEESDLPWEEHCRWFPDCYFLLGSKGEEYVEDVYMRTEKGKRCKRRVEKYREKVKQITHNNDTEEMKLICKKLGYSQNDIEQVLVLNGKPFERIGFMIEALHIFENDFTTVENSSTLLKNDAKSIDSLKKDKDQTKQSKLAQCVSETHEKKVIANHISLPCGHLIYCSECKEKALTECSSEVKPCPIDGCQVEIKAFMKIYMS